jgi:N-dimethylarginine dimethylaminohydrolase
MTSAETFKVYHKGILPFKIKDLNGREEPLKILMCSPDYFNIIDVKNIHMEGNSNALNSELAQTQWQSLKSVYESLVERKILSELLVIPGEEGCEDMVFCANQTFPWIKQNKKEVWMSRMRHPSRQKEVPFFETYFTKLNYQARHFARTPMFEGMGDTIPHPNKMLLYGGYGHRTNPKAYEELSENLGVPIIALELINENFYHLDTCFVPISETKVMLCKEAFTEDGLQLLRQSFEEIIEIPTKEAISNFSLNAHVIINHGLNQRVTVIQKGSKVTKKALLENGFEVIEVNTSEYMKSGGSVFCMKMMLY